MKNIGMIVAMEEEGTQVFDVLGERRPNIVLGKYVIAHYVRGDVNVYSVYSGIGEIAGALAASALIHACRPDVLINFGVAGALIGGIGIKQVVAVREIVHYDHTHDSADPEKCGYYLGETRNWFDCDKMPLEKLKSIDNLREVRLASGDKFISDGKTKEWLIKQFGAEVCEMEAMGIYFAAKAYGIPCLFIKAISDNADDNADEDFYSMFAHCSKLYAELVIKLISVL